MRSFLYRLARGLGDVNAARRGPSAYGHRVVRKQVRRRVGRNLQRLGL